MGSGDRENQDEEGKRIFLQEEAEEAERGVVRDCEDVGATHRER